MKAKIIIFLAFILFFAGCGDDESTDDDGPYPTEGYVYLENQEEHSRIAVEILEADTFIFTDSSGFYDLSFLPDGEYSLNLVFPYYVNENLSISILDSLVSISIPEIELQQALKCSFEINDTVFHEGDTIFPSGIAKNISDVPFIIHSTVWPVTGTVILEGDSIVAYDNQIIFPTFVYDTLLPGEFMVVGPCIELNDIMPGEYEIFTGVSTLEFNQEIVSMSDYSDIPIYIYSKFNRKSFRVIP